MVFLSQLEVFFLFMPLACLQLVAYPVGSGSLLVIQVLQSYEEGSGNRFGSE